MLPFVEIQGCCSTPLPPLLNNRFRLIGQLHAPPPKKTPTIPRPLQPFQPIFTLKKKKKKPWMKPVVFHLFLTRLWMKTFQSRIPVLALDIFPDHLKDSSGRNKTQCTMRLFMFIHPSIYQAFGLSFSVLLRCQHRQLYPRNKPCISSASNHGLQRHHSNTTVYRHHHAKKKKKTIIWRDCKCLNIQKWEYKKYCRLLQQKNYNTRRNTIKIRPFKHTINPLWRV